jgi:hypothetical protein
VYAWYDNEVGYACRMVELANIVIAPVDGDDDQVIAGAPIMHLAPQCTAVWHLPTRCKILER